MQDGHHEKSFRGQKGLAQQEIVNLGERGGKKESDLRDRLMPSSLT